MTVFADPYKVCLKCGQWIDGAEDGPGPLILIPCGHQSDYLSVCPSWSPVDGCRCDWYNTRNPYNKVGHDMRPRPDNPPAGVVYGPAPIDR